MTTFLLRNWRGLLPVLALLLVVILLMTMSTSMQSVVAQVSEPHALAITSQSPGSLSCAGPWRNEPTMMVGRALAASAVANDKLYAMGGYDSGSTISPANEQFDPATNLWTSKAAVPTPVVQTQGATVANRIYLPGGSTASGGSTTMQIYDTTTDTWSQGASLPQALMSEGVASFNGKVYLMGGYIGNPGSASTAVFEYDPATNLYTTKSPMPVSHSNFSAVVLDNAIYIAGGVEGGSGHSSYSYNPATDVWTAIAPFQIDFRSFGGFALDGEVWLVGGSDQNGNLQQPNYQVNIYNPTSNTWRLGPLLNVQRAYSTSAGAMLGRGYVVGGLGISSNYLTNMESTASTGCQSPTTTPTIMASPTPPATNTSTATRTPTATSTPIATATPECGLAWHVLSSPNPGFSNILFGVDALSQSDVWAVGRRQDQGPEMTFTTHWDGASWTMVPSPNINGAEQNDLVSVAAISANDIWAVGFVTLGNHQQTLAIHWNGSQWDLISTPNIGSNSNFLWGIAAISSSDVWAVGSYVNPQFRELTLSMHWDGSMWQVVSSPNTGGGDNRLNSVSSLSTNDVWAVGSSAASDALAEHWDGSQWSVAPVPRVGDLANGFSSVSSASPTDVWAAGYYEYIYNNTVHKRTLIQHWDGSQWSQSASDNVGVSDNHLSGIVASNGEIWSVGTYFGSGIYQTLTLHNGSLVPSPNVGTSYNWLTGVTSDSSSPWAVGYAGVSAERTLSIRYYDPCGTPIPSPTRTATASTTATAFASTTSTPVRPSATVTETGTTAPSRTAISSYTATATHTPIPPTSTLVALTPSPTACTLQFTDVPSANTFYPFVRCLSCRGIISGYQCGGVSEPCDGDNNPYFRPNVNITRGQIAKIVSNSAGYSDDPNPQIYEDVDPTNTFYQWINRLSRRGFMGGYPCGTVPQEPCNPPNDLSYFRPFANATRGQLAKIVSNAAGFSDVPPDQIFTDVPPDNGFYLWVQRLASRGIMGGYFCGGDNEPCDDQQRPYFRPYNSVTRGQTSKIVGGAFFPDCQTPNRH